MVGFVFCFDGRVSDCTGFAGWVFDCAGFLRCGVPRLEQAPSGESQLWHEMAGVFMSERWFFVSWHSYRPSRIGELWKANWKEMVRWKNCTVYGECWTWFFLFFPYINCRILWRWWMKVWKISTRENLVNQSIFLHTRISLNGQKVWEYYLENHKPATGQIFWVYGSDKNDITVIGLEPHPNDKKNAYQKNHSFG